MAVAEGKSPAALVNIGTYFRWRNSGDPNAFKASERLSLVFPVNEKGKTCYHLTVAAIPRDASKRSEALMLISFLITQESQSFYSESAFEFPVNVYAMPSDLLMQNGVFLEASLDWAEVNQQLEAAQQLLAK
jgi:iron(III) transport system substrate-binding protein